MKTAHITPILALFYYLMATPVCPADLTADHLLEQIELGKTHLKVGLTKRQVANLAGRPYNNPDENVWIWCFDLNRTNQKMNWRKYAQEGGVFLVFVNGKTIKGIRSTVACLPEEVYSSVYKVEEESVPSEYRMKEK